MDQGVINSLVLSVLGTMEKSVNDNGLYIQGTTRDKRGREE